MDEKSPKERSLYQFDEEFRDTIATVDAGGKRVWVYPKKPSGRYYRWRVLVSFVLLSLFFVGPFIQYQGRSFILLNFFERKFILFGQIFWPQDFFLLALTLIIFFVFIILFTTAFGRIWCGWTCPQTVFMEMVFRKIEYWIEGNANEQRKLDKASWGTAKTIKKISKHSIFFLIALLIAHVVMAYLVGKEQALAIVSMPPSQNIIGFISILAFTCIFYGVFAYFREQVCIAVCPYGRLQGVLLVRDSIAVMYDWLRGEPRGKLKKGSQHDRSDSGDCIDCKLCVHACPTGIDIRHGTQLECVNCTACIDACDEVMDKIGKPKGLIRYSSHNAIRGKIKFVFTPRLVGYTIILSVLAGVLSYLIFTRTDIEATILKAPGTLYSKTADGQIANVYNIEFVNKTFEDISLEVKIELPKQALLSLVGGATIVVPKEGMLKKIFVIKLPEQEIRSSKRMITLGIYQGDKKIETAHARFIGPFKH